MDGVNHRFVNLADEKLAVQKNAEVLLRAAHEYSDAVRGEFRHQITGSLEQFQSDIDRIMETYAGKPISQPGA